MNKTTLVTIDSIENRSWENIFLHISDSNEIYMTVWDKQEKMSVANFLWVDFIDLNNEKQVNNQRLIAYYQKKWYHLIWETELNSPYPKYITDFLNTYRIKIDSTPEVRVKNLNNIDKEFVLVKLNLPEEIWIETSWKITKFRDIVKKILSAF